MQPQIRNNTYQLFIHCGDYDLSGSFVIGDRLSDIKLAKNLGARGILIHDIPCADADLVTRDWDRIVSYLTSLGRSARVQRKTKETTISIDLNLDGTGESDNATGLGFFDHMLDQLAKHGQLDLNIKVQGDLHVDEHHTIEDTAIALGEAFQQALGNKRGIERYGFTLPMDDILA